LSSREENNISFGRVGRFALNNAFCAFWRCVVKRHKRTKNKKTRYSPLELEVLVVNAFVVTEDEASATAAADDGDFVVALVGFGAFVATFCFTT
jgi:hypothetical protein